MTYGGRQDVARLPPYLSAPSILYPPQLFHFLGLRWQRVLGLNCPSRAIKIQFSRVAHQRGRSSWVQLCDATALIILAQRVLEPNRRLPLVERPLLP